MSGIIKQDVLIHGKNEEEKLALAKAYDAYTFSSKRQIPCFTGFLTPADMALTLMAFKGENVSCFGGYEEAERCVLGFGAEDNSDFPVCVIKASGDFHDVSHRDFLGGIMSLGITRENIGDIVRTDECCYIFVLKKMADYVAENLLSVKKSKVKSEICECFEVLVEKEFETVKKSVASLRADAVVAAMFNLSRDDSASAIKRGLVSVNYRVFESLDKRLSEGDTVSLKGKGKAKIEHIGDFTKKGRMFIEIKKYK